MVSQSEGHVKDPDLAKKGFLRIEYAAREMQVLNLIKEEFASSKPLEGTVIFQVNSPRDNWSISPGLYPHFFTVFSISSTSSTQHKVLGECLIFSLVLGSSSENHL